MNTDTFSAKPWPPLIDSSLPVDMRRDEHNTSAAVFNGAAFGRKSGPDLVPRDRLPYNGSGLLARFIAGRFRGVLALSRPGQNAG